MYFFANVDAGESVACTDSQEFAIGRNCAGGKNETGRRSDVVVPCVARHTLGLMQAMPRLGKKKKRLYNIPGVVPHITQMPEGCHFAPRCPYATDECRAKCPELEVAGDGHMVRCFHYQKIRTEEKGE